MKTLDLSMQFFERDAVLIAICFLMMIPIVRSEVIRDPPGVRRQHGTRPVSVTDAIQMTNLVEYDSRISAEHNPALFSPSGKTFVIVTKKGNVSNNTNSYSLLLFDTDRAPLSPAPGVLISLSSSSNRPAIQDVKWIDDHTIVFLGENPGEPQQVYEVDCETRRLARLTGHPTGVIAYAINPNQNKFYFLGSRPVRPLFDERAKRSGLVVSDQPLADLIAGESRWSSVMFADLFVKTIEGNETPVRTGSNFIPDRIWLSPNGRYLIGTGLVLDIPKIWKDYEDRSVQKRVRAMPLHGDPQFLRQYVLIDVESGQAEPLLDAPLGDGGYSEVLWSSDSNSVVVSGVYLPLNTTDAIERKIRQSDKVIAEIKIPSLEIVPISSKEICSLRCWLSWDSTNGNLIVESTVYSGATNPEPGAVTFQRAPEGWREVDSPPSRLVLNHPKITVTLEEDMNVPPRLFVKDIATGEESLLLDLNPQFKDLEFGRVQNVAFEAADGHKVSAGLYLPPDYGRGRRYPLVIQTHGWHPERFWIDGPWPSAFAAQALAGKGFVVLQLSEDVSATIVSTPEEAPKEMSAYEGGIDYLDRLGIIDRDRVGLIGFSRSGLGVEYALTHSRYHFAAATLAEPSDGGYFFYMAILPSFSWRWPDLEGINGGSPFAEGLASWTKSSPGFNLARVTTPVREEAYGPQPLFLVWEWFAGLSRLDKPVELIYIRDGDHTLVRPLDRLTSQQGNVDWFCFWLRDQEDQDPTKAEQYARWHKLRELQQQNQKAK